MRTAFHRGITHVSMYKIDRVMNKEKFDTSPDPDPEWLFRCLINRNRKCTTLPVLHTSQSISLVRVKVSELQIDAVCIRERGEFYIM